MQTKRGLVVASPGCAIPLPEDGPSPRGRWLPWIVVACWLCVVALGFWRFEFRQLTHFSGPRPFAAAWDSTQVADAQKWFRQSIAPTQPVAPAAAFTLVHLYRPDCDCNRFTDRHVAAIEKQFRGRGMRLIRVASNAGNAPPNGAWLASTPAAFVFDAAGSLVYFGPYSDSAWCGTSAGLVERAMERILAGNPPHPSPQPAWGCFCDATGRGSSESPT